MKSFAVGEVWLAKFPFEEDPNKYSPRPVIVLDKDNTVGVLSVKVTKHGVREYDPYDIPIVYWDKAGLHVASTARVAKTMILDETKFIHKIGSLQPKDLNDVQAKYIEYLNSLS